jgi:nicotinamidase/pyrazinamidase
LILDGIDEGFNMHIVEDAVKGIDLDGSLKAAWDEMKSKGVNVVQSDSIVA